MNIEVGELYFTREAIVSCTKSEPDRFLLVDVNDGNNFWWVNQDGKCIINGEDLHHLAIEYSVRSEAIQYADSMISKRMTLESWRLLPSYHGYEQGWEQLNITIDKYAHI